MHRLQTTKLDIGQKTRDSLKQHTHKQKAPAHQTVTRNYKIVTYRGITFATIQAVQYHHTKLQHTEH